MKHCDAGTAFLPVIGNFCGRALLRIGVDCSSSLGENRAALIQHPQNRKTCLSLFRRLSSSKSLNCQFDYLLVGMSNIFKLRIVPFGISARDRKLLI
jgi:hypothetical protein